MRTAQCGQSLQGMLLTVLRQPSALQALGLNRQLGAMYSEAAHLAIAMIAGTMFDRWGRKEAVSLGGAVSVWSLSPSVLSLLEQLDQCCMPGGGISVVVSAEAPSSNESGDSAVGLRGPAEGDTGNALGVADGSGTTASQPLGAGMVVKDDELQVRSLPVCYLALSARTQHHVSSALRRGSWGCVSWTRHLDCCEVCCRVGGHAVLSLYEAYCWV